MKAAQEHLHGHSQTEVPKRYHNTLKENESENTEHHEDEHDHGFAAERVISEMSKFCGFTWRPCPLATFKKDLSKEQIKAAQEHIYMDTIRQSL